MAQRKSKKRSEREIDILAGNRLARKIGMKTSARDGLYSANITPTEKQRKCKTGEVYSTKLNKCVARKGQDPRFGKDRPKKAQKAITQNQRRLKKRRPIARPGDFGEGPKSNK